MKKTRWGIVSAGRISHTFAHDMQFVENGELCAVAARSVEDAERFAQKYGIPKAYGGYSALFDDSHIDAVYISTPHSLHLENSKDALQAGKAVLCEKPLTVGSAECRELMDAAAGSGAYLMEGMWTYFLPAIQKAQQWISQGRIGRLRHVKVDFGYPLNYDPKLREYDSELGGGCVLEMGIYPVALAWLFIGQNPRDFDVRLRRAPNGVEDDVVAIFDYEDQVATIATSFRCKLQNWAYVIGDEGYIAIPDFWRANACHLYHLDELIESYDDGRAGLGFEFQTTSVGEDLSSGRTQSERMPLETSLRLQEHMALIRG